MRIVLSCWLLSACGGDPELVCGAGTVEHDGVCLPDDGADADTDTDVDCAAPDVDGDRESSIECGGDDCDDGDPAIGSLADDPFGDGVDQDCGGEDGVDEDEDGHARDPGDDCDDASVLVHPDARDPDGDCIDQDCDGAGGPDEDADGFDSNLCFGEDCDDADAAVGPTAADPLGDGADTNCDGVDGEDLDGDGHVSIPSGGDDCNDGDADTHPGAVDLFGDGIDQDCAGEDGIDVDEDGHASEASGGDDCDDADAAIHPGVDEDEAWSLETVDSEGDTGLYSSIALDGDVPHIGYHDVTEDSIRHAVDPLGIWLVDEVSPVTPGYPSVSLAVQAGRSHVVWYDNYPSDLVYATDDPFAWVVETADETAGQTGVSPSVAVDDDGVAHVAYVDLSFSLLRYARREGGTWTLETIVAGTCGAAVPYDCRPDVAVDAGVVHVSYGDAESVMYARREAGDWTLEVVTPIETKGGLVAATAAIAVEDGTPHVLYSDRATADLLHASRDAGVWTSETVDDGGSGAYSIAVEGGFVHVVYQSSEADGDPLIAYATDARGGWERETIDLRAGSTPSIAVGPAFVHVASYEPFDQDLRYARRGRPDGVDSDCDGVD